MPSVDFYILSDERPEAVLIFTCRLVEKVYRLGHRIVINVVDSNVAQRLDELLWTFKQDSFVPHARVDQMQMELDKVIIGPWAEVAGKLPTEYMDVLVNLEGAALGEIDSWRRVAEPVGADANSKQAGRARFRHYRELGFDIQTHNV